MALHAEPAAGFRIPAAALRADAAWTRDVLTTFDPTPREVLYLARRAGRANTGAAGEDTARTLAGCLHERMMEVAA
ncbi:MAG TPA: hypothetical protein VFJ82_10390 [Longimicrobium sp.]|nr:hypothetical protein [Longimicrobium sp.]